MFNDFFMFISLLFRARFLEFSLLFFDCFPICAKPKNIENSLVLIHYSALGTFRNRTQKREKQYKKSNSFGIDFSWKIITFSHSKSAWIFEWFFIENGLQKYTIFNEKTIQKSMLILNPKKSWFLMKSQCKNCLSFCIEFLFFLFVFEKCLMQNNVLKPMNFQWF